MEGRQLEFRYESLVPWSLFDNNIKANLQRTVPRLLDVLGLGRATEPAAIVGGGPSLKSQIDNLKNFNGKIYSCGTVHDFLIENQIVPDYHVVMDPDVETANFIKHPQKTTTYLLASQCHQKTFDALRNNKILLWHSFVTRTDDDQEPISDFNNEPSIRGGGSVVLRAYPIACLLGHKNIHFFGFDCSFPLGTEGQHAYDYPHFKEEVVSVSVNGHKYYTTPGLMIQLQSFVTYVSFSRDLEIVIHGDNLLAAVCYRDKLCQI